MAGRLLFPQIILFVPYGKNGVWLEKKRKRKKNSTAALSGFWFLNSALNLRNTQLPPSL